MGYGNVAPAPFRSCVVLSLTADEGEVVLCLQPLTHIAINIAAAILKLERPT
jgi:hypothetical protein